MDRQTSTRCAIAFDNVCFGYAGGDEVLHNISFSLPEHALAGIVGPNGGGKTTLLKLVLGLLKPRFGSVRIFDEAPDAARKKIGYVPQAFNFDSAYPISIGEVVISGRIERTRFGRYSAEDRQAASHALQRVGLDGFAKRPFSDLSGGQRQRVLVAQALASSPDLLLLDEPTANVDERAAHTLHELFAELAKEITVVMVSHNLSIVEARATHVICVNHTADLHITSEMHHNHLVRSGLGDDYLVLEHDHNCKIVSDTHLHTHNTSLDSEHC